MPATTEDLVAFRAGAFPSTPQAVPQIRSFVRENAAPPASPQIVDDLVLAVSEACTNSVLHSTGAEVTIRLEIYPDAVAVEIEDHGSFDAETSEDAAAWEGPATGGRGITIMVALSDEMFIRKGAPEQPGTLVRLVKRTSPEASANA